MAIACWTPWVNYAAAPRWAVLSLGVPLAAALLKPELTFELLGLGFTLVYMAVSGLWTPSQPDWAQELWIFALLSGAFAIGQSLTKDQAKPVYIALGIGLLPSVAISLAAYLGDPIFTTIGAGEAGTFFNSNIFGEIIFPMLLVLGMDVPLLTAFLSVGACVVFLRSGILGLTSAMLVYLISKRQVVIAAAIVTLSLLVLYLITLIKGSSSLGYRLAVWLPTIKAMTPFGHGAGSFFSDSVALGKFPERMAHPHNELIHYIYELGVGAIPLIAIAVTALRGKVTNERLALVVLFVEAMFGFPFHVPTTLFLGGLLLGRLCGDRAGLHIYADRRPEPSGARRPACVGV